MAKSLVSCFFFDSQCRQVASASAGTAELCWRGDACIRAAWTFRAVRWWRWTHVQRGRVVQWDDGVELTLDDDDDEREWRVGRLAVSSAPAVTAPSVARRPAADADADVDRLRARDSSVFTTAQSRRVHTLNISAALYILLYSHKLQLQKQEIKKAKEKETHKRERVYFPYSKNTWTSTQQKCKIRRVARKALGPSKLATHNVSKSTTCQMHTNYAERKRKIT